MKRIFLAFIFIFSIQNTFSQSLKVKTDYSNDYLINSVLINAVCNQASNIQASTGTQFGSVNGIGYFENSNPAFPFAKGIFLSTGDAAKAKGPNNSILKDGNTNWPGDQDLEKILLEKSGITIASMNASYIEFDFKPRKSDFDFSFLFASEEYGVGQCQYSDAFAFILKDVTANGPAINLAVLPEPALPNTPITVETIRDQQYNPYCPSANKSFFGQFNGPGFDAATNYNGNTVKMTASAKNLDITHTYRIKLVIADGNNNPEYDSAIFLEANSFNIGQDILGPDYTTANNNAICPGTPLPIITTSALPEGTTFEWKLNGQPLSPSQSGNSLDLNKIDTALTSGLYTITITYTEQNCVPVTNDIIVEILPKIGITLPFLPYILLCNNGQNSQKVNLIEQSKKIIKQLPNPNDDLPLDTLINYFLSQGDALNLKNYLPIDYETKTQNTETIFTRIENPNTHCFEILEFNIYRVKAPYIQTNPNTIISCEKTIADHKAEFNLTSAKNQIFGNQNTNINKLSFYWNLNEANNKTNPIKLNSDYSLTSASATIWARLENAQNPECYVTTNINLEVLPLPEIDKLPNVIRCDSYTLPILTKTGAEYWTGTNKSGKKLYAGDNITVSDTLYVYNSNGNCSNESRFVVHVVDLDAIAPQSKKYCSQYVLPVLPYGKYYAKSGGPYTAGNSEIKAGSIIDKAGINKLYLWFESKEAGNTCIREKEINLEIVPFTPLSDYKDIFSCNAVALATDPNGGIYYSGPNKQLPTVQPGTIINASQTLYVVKETIISNGESCISEKPLNINVGVSSITPPTDVTACFNYELPKLNVGEYRTAASGGGKILAEGTLIDKTTTLWFHVPGQDCTNNMSFTVKIIPMEPLPSMNSDITACDGYYLPEVSHPGNYYTESLGKGSLLEAGTPITNSQTVYFYDQSTEGNCYLEKPINISVFPSPKIDTRPTEVVRCNESYFLDDLTNGEYYEFSGGPSDKNPILPAGTEISKSKTIYVYAGAQAPNSCSMEYPIKIYITNTIVTKLSDMYGCESFILPAITGPGDYYTAPGGPNGNGAKLSPPYAPIMENCTLYVYAEDNQRIKCSDEDEFKVIILKKPVLAPIAPISKCKEFKLPDYSSPVTAYYAKAGGPATGNTQLLPGDLVKQTSTIYAYANSGSVETSTCGSEQPMQITIWKQPKPELTIPSICVNKENETIKSAEISTDLDSANHSFEWRWSNGVILSNAAIFSTKLAGDYSLRAIDLSIPEGCASEPIPFYVPQAGPPKAIDIKTTGWFTDNQDVTVNAVALPGFTDDFTYAIDGSSFQTENTFTDLAPGNHEITVSNKENCSSTTVWVTLISSPKYFTPNGDGSNDYWYIPGLKNQKSLSRVTIYDKYGKLIKQFRTADESWDGTLNGEPMPVDDYWFSVIYNENGAEKEYKSHFSLIR